MRTTKCVGSVHNCSQSHQRLRGHGPTNSKLSSRQLHFQPARLQLFSPSPCPCSTTTRTRKCPGKLHNRVSNILSSGSKRCVLEQRQRVRKVLVSSRSQCMSSVLILRSHIRSRAGLADAETRSLRCHTRSRRTLPCVASNAGGGQLRILPAREG